MPECFESRKAAVSFLQSKATNRDGDDTLERRADGGAPASMPNALLTQDSRCALLRRPSAVDNERRSSDETRGVRRQEHDGANQFIGLAETSERRRAADPVAHLRGMLPRQRRIDVAWRDRVHTHTERCHFE